jgi:hypothetical protein
MFIDIYQIYNIEYIDKEVLNFATEKIKHSKEFNEIYTKRFIFSPFVELFNGNSTNFPSKFVDVNSSDLNELKYLLNNNNNILYNETNSIMKTLVNYHNRIKVYEALVDDLMIM